MEEIAKKHIDRICDIRRNVERSREYDRGNNERFNKFKKFIFETTMDDNDRNALQDADKSPVEINVLESYLSRLWGEFSKQVPEITVRAQGGDVSPEQVNVVESHIRSILSGSDYEILANYVYRDAMSGGFSVLHVNTEYENDSSMRQVIRVNRVFDPTLTGFDPLSREPSKHDGEFCYMLFPKYKKELEREYPGVDFDRIKSNSTVHDDKFKWAYKESDEDVYYVCDYYKKQYKYVTMYEISDPEDPDETHSVTKSEYEKLIESWDSISAPPEILNKDKRRSCTIVRYRFIDETPLERPVDTDYDYLPLIFVDGNSSHLDGKQLTRPYIYNAVDAQRLKNLAASNITTELESSRQTDVLIAKESMPAEPEYQEGWLNPQRSQAALVWDSKGEEGQPTPKPEIFPRSQLNSAFLQVFEMQDKTIQTVLGSYDAQLGLQQSQLSGVAIVEGATQSNNAAMPYVINYMASLNQVAKVIASLLPKYYKTARTIPVVKPDGKHDYVLINSQKSMQPVMFDFEKNDIEVIVKAGANFDVQRNKALITMTELMKTSEAFKMLMETKGLPLLLDNIDIRGKDQLKQMSEEFLKEQAEQKAKAGQKPNPQEQMVQAQIQAKQAELKLQAQKQQNDVLIQQEKLKQSQMKLLSDIDNDRSIAQLRLQEAQNEADRTQAQIAIDIYDKQISHFHKIMGL